ncbi:hypothetical protein OnM2_036064 [Erysiphe neolycopersici]|uniref:Uncharacterized protein n=1 Tax=Erysiphe neolycopersici TaxID=212602 RepID=A0A420HXD8_9PEZI|nr:hypothetical protein OnM2_036064 [Erysiphe neolycopersici]
MAPKPFKPPVPSTVRSSSLSSPSVTMNKKPPDRSKDSPSLSKQKSNMNSSKIVSGPSSRTATSMRGRNKVSNVSSVNKRRKIVDRRASSMSTIKLPSLSPNTNDEDESNENTRSLIDSQAEEGTSSDQEDEAMRNSEIDEIMDDNDDDEDDDDPFGSDTNLPRRSKKHSARQLSNQNGDDEELDQILADIDDDIDIDLDNEDDSSITKNSEEQDIFIPRDLLSVLLHEMFKSTEDTQDIERDENRGENKRATKRGQIRMTKQAVDAVGKYLDTFVKEAVARAACEDLERGGSGVLEVEDLERLAPQLLLDF